MPFSKTTPKRVPAGTETFLPGALSTFAGTTGAGADVCGPTDSCELAIAPAASRAMTAATGFQGHLGVGNMKILRPVPCDADSTVCGCPGPESDLPEPGKDA